MRNGVNRTFKRGRARDLLIYTSVSLVVAVALISAAVRGEPESQILNWFGVLLFTGIVFGDFLLRSRRVWTKPLFWSVFGFAFAAHVCVCMWLFRAGGVIPGARWLFLALFEIAVLFWTRQCLFGAGR